MLEIQARNRTAVERLVHFGADQGPDQGQGWQTRQPRGCDCGMRWRVRCYLPAMRLGAAPAMLSLNAYFLLDRVLRSTRQEKLGRAGQGLVGRPVP